MDELEALKRKKILESIANGGPIPSGYGKSVVGNNIIITQPSEEKIIERGFDEDGKPYVLTENDFPPSSVNDLELVEPDLLGNSGVYEIKNSDDDRLTDEDRKTLNQILNGRR